MGTVLEVGCGNGAFLVDLLDKSLTAWNGIGLDPAYAGDSPRLGGRLRFTSDYFDERHQTLSADILFSRHVIEHVSDPVSFARRMVTCASANPHARVLLETPCCAWTLTNHAFWDISYEHCSLFTSASIRTLLCRAGAEALSVESVFGDQYLLAKARPAFASSSRLVLPRQDWATLVQSFSDGQADWTKAVARKIEGAKTRGRIAVWGAAGKGAMFCNRIDPAAEMIDVVFDRNANKHNKYLGGTGHPIRRPDKDSLMGTRLIVVMNSNYLTEISEQAYSMNPAVEIIAAESTSRPSSTGDARPSSRSSHAR
jgi:hypothetical protein